MSLLINILSDEDKNSLENIQIQSVINQIVPDSYCVFQKKFDTTDIIEPAFNLLINSTVSHFLLTVVNTKIKINLPESYLLALVEQRWYLLPNNGIISIFNNHTISNIFEIPLSIAKNVYFANDVLKTALQQLIKSNWDAEKIGFTKLKEVVRGGFVQPSNTDNKLKLNMVYCDANGDVYLNLTESEFEKFVGEKSFKIRITFSYIINKISKHYSMVPEGEIAAFFHASGLLCLKQHHGNAQRAIGMNKDKQIILQVEQP